MKWESDKEVYEYIGRFCVEFEQMCRTMEVCARTIRLNAQGHDVWRQWEEDDVLQKIQHILLEKDSKTYHGGPYERLALVIHTDEPLVDPRDFASVIQEHQFVRPKKITEAYLLFSYEHSTQSCPVVKLSFES